MATGLSLNVCPQPALGLLDSAQLIWETSPGPVLSMPVYPRPALALLDFAAIVYDNVLTVYPRPSLSLLDQVQLVNTLPQFAAPRPLRTWQRDVQKFAISQERERHVQALWQYGELVVFALMWTTLDLAAGLAQRCTRCNVNVGATSPEQSIAAAYGQGSQFRCPLCYGSQLIAAGTVAQHPGLRAVIVRPAVITDIDKAQEFTARGVMNTGQVSTESTPDFRVRNGDYMFRQDSTRYRLRVPRRVTLRTGFASPYQQVTTINYTHASAGLEDPTSVAYTIPPDATALASWLGTYTRVPVSYAGLEIINGPLIPEEEPPPAATASLQPNVTFPLPAS